MRILIITAGFAITSALTGYTQESSQRCHFKFSIATITQYKPPVHSPYNGQNSIIPQAEIKTSYVSTLFSTIHPFENTTFQFDPEVAGGKGLSGAVGVAGFPNAQTFRIGGSQPQVYIARIFIQHNFPLTNKSYLKFTLGKFSLPDFIDQNKYANDPTTQFMNWVLVNNGAWDFAADTRGYTWGVAVEYIKNDIRVRGIAALEPESANGLKMDTDVSKSLGSNLEFEIPYAVHRLPGVFRFLIYFNRARMGNYKMSINNPINGIPDITSTRRNGRTKLGLCANFQQKINSDTGIFSRIGWNDGQNETWAFTEIDRYSCIGVSIIGSSWHKPEDHAGLAFVINMLSKPHREYLAAGGSGFILGDGHLNYSPEFISELYYNASLAGDHFQIAPDYQLILNPAYNKDRGPISVFSVRLHIEI